MIEKTWDLTKVTDRIQLEAIRHRRPLSCLLELTYRCNFRCRMCYVRMTDAQAAPFGRMRTVDEWKDMARQLYDAGVLYLTLSGGECTQYPGFEDLYEALCRMGFYVNIMSNAGAYTDGIRELFRKFPPHGVAVTLYGGTDRTYKEVTGDPKGLEKALGNIRFLQSIGVPVALNYTAVRQNVRDYPAVGRICRELGLPYTMITDVTPHRYGAPFSDAASSKLSPAQRACVACRPPEEVEEALADAPELEKELARFEFPRGEGLPAPGADACIGSHTGCAIGWNGDMQTCVSMLRYRPVKPFESGFEAAWAQIKAMWGEEFARPAACAACGMAKDCIHNCAGRRWEGTGRTERPDPDTCRYTYLLRLYRARRNAPDIPLPPPCS